MAPEFSSEVTRLELTRADALVLFEWLHSHEEAGTTPGDKAERIALWALSCALERVLAEPFSAEYVESIEAARAELTSDLQNDERASEASGAINTTAADQEAP